MASHLPHAYVSGWPPRRVDAGCIPLWTINASCTRENGVCGSSLPSYPHLDVSSTTNVDNQTQTSAIPSNTTRFTLSALSSRLYSHHEGRNRRNDSYQHECRQKT